MSMKLRASLVLPRSFMYARAGMAPRKLLRTGVFDDGASLPVSANVLSMSRHDATDTVPLLTAGMSISMTLS